MILYKFNNGVKYFRYDKTKKKYLIINIFKHLSHKSISLVNLKNFKKLVELLTDR